MVTYEDLKGIIKDIKKDRVMVKALRVLIITLAIWFLVETPWYFIDKATGKHDKFLFGLGECNIPKDHPDTIVKMVTRTIIDTVYKAGKKTFNNKIDRVRTLNQN